MDSIKDFIERNSKPLFIGSCVVIGLVVVGFVLDFAGINIWAFLAN
jgi:hypothetical protein